MKQTTKPQTKTKTPASPLLQGIVIMYYYYMRSAFLITGELEIFLNTSDLID